jgi:hypothetical protein
MAAALTVAVDRFWGGVTATRFHGDFSVIPRDLRADSTDVVIEDDPEQYHPICPICQQKGRERAGSSRERQFFCAHCGARWVVRKRSDVGISS